MKWKKTLIVTISRPADNDPRWNSSLYLVKGKQDEYAVFTHRTAMEIACKMCISSGFVVDTCKPPITTIQP